MRFLFLICLVFAWSACGNPPADTLDVTDSVESAEKIKTSVYFMMMSSATQVTLPSVIESSEMEKLPGLKIDDQSGYDLLPADFEPQSYKSVYCIGRSSVADGVNALWFKLTSAGEYEDGPDNMDYMMVLYDKDGTPQDVCMVAYSALGYGYSYVRTDSLFTVQVDEMEDIHVTTYAVEIGKNGFMPTASVRTTFPSSQKGSDDSDKYMNEFINRHK